MIRYLLTLSLFISTASLFAQQATLKGTITDQEGEPIYSANVIVDASTGLASITDFSGKYSLSLAAGTYQVTYRYIGKEEQVTTVTLAAGEEKVLNVELQDKTELLDQVVVSASKYEKKLSEETVSIEVLKGETLRSANAIDMEEGMNKVPGVQVIDGQANIRGGSGWSYGAGSRVMVLVDDIPLLSGDAGDAKWGIIPMENVEQVEVLKGAASSLYGSSALNGIINMRTAWPKNKPYTAVSAYGGFYGTPKIKAAQWWPEKTVVGSDSSGVFFPEDSAQGQPYFTGADIVHRQKFGNFDLVLGGAFVKEQSYLIGGGYSFLRTNIKTRYRPENIDGLSFGLNFGGYRSTGSNYFVWNGYGTDTTTGNNYDSLAFTPLPGSTSKYVSYRVTIDPFVTYFDKKNNRFSFRGRFFNATNTVQDADQGSIPNLYFGELQYQRNFIGPGLNVVAGISGYYSDVNAPKGDPENSLFGEHTGSNYSVYGQLDKKFFGKLNVAIGARYEYFRVDTFKSDAKPVFRIGVNYEAAKATFLRASFGQGYRFPTIGEKFARTSIGSIGIYPNPLLEPETGWSAELGIKQGYKAGKSWKGYVDLSGFINEYQNMIEFNFGNLGPPNPDLLGLGLGFSAQNVGDTRIIGGEFVATGIGELNDDLDLALLASYTYINPTSLNWNDTITLYTHNGTEIRPGTYSETSTSEENVLKYRSKHLVKADAELTFKEKYSIGVSVQYNSWVQNIDALFESQFLIGVAEPIFGTKAFSGIRNYRDENDGKGTLLLDLRARYEFSEGASVAFIVKNALNELYTQRPGYLEKPINFSIKLSYVIDKNKE